MKTIFKIFMVCMFIFTFGNEMTAQRYSHNKIVTVIQGDSIYKVEIHKGLTKYFNEMINRMLENNVDLSRLNDFEGMYMYGKLHRYVGYSVWAVSVRNPNAKDFIYFSTDIQKYLPTFISAIMYHEFYHFLTSGGGHCEMSDIDDSVFIKIKKYFTGYADCPYILQNGSKIDVEEVIKTWDAETKKEYFAYLKWAMEFYKGNLIFNNSGKQE